MKKLVLVENNHLILLGLQKLLDSLSAEWETISLNVDNVHKRANTDLKTDLVVLGLPLDPHEAQRTVTTIEQTLRPARMLLLSEQAAPWSPLECGAGSIYACIDKKAAPDTLIAAVQLGMSYVRSPAEHVDFDSARSDSSLPPEAALDSGCDFRYYDRAGVHSGQQLSDIDAAVPAEQPAKASDSCATPCMDENGAADGFNTDLLSITPRQYEVLKLLARGYPIKTVARMMNIALATAKAHTASLYRQLKVNSRGEAVYTARQKGVPLN